MNWTWKVALSPGLVELGCPLHKIDAAIAIFSRSYLADESYAEWLAELRRIDIIPQEPPKRSRSMKLDPLGDYVLIRPDDPTLTYGTGDVKIHIPEAHTPKSQYGTVVAVGPGLEEWKMRVSVGDRIVYGRYSGVEVECDNEKMLMIRDPDLIAKVLSDGK